MHNSKVQLLTVGSRKIISICFSGHEKLIFEVIPDEVLRGPVSILGEDCSIFPLALVNIYGM